MDNKETTQSVHDVVVRTLEAHDKGKATELDLYRTLMLVKNHWSIITKE